MEITGDTVDDVLIDLYRALLQSPYRNAKGTRGPNTEMLGVALRIRNPRARISRSEDRGKPFSAIGEFLWYLSKSDRLEFIEDYIPNYREEAVDGVLYGAYGPRLFTMRGSVDQIENVTTVLKRNAGSRRAVVQLFNAEDIADRHPEVPCTSTIQFHIRNGSMHVSVTMRSNDAYFGLPHDVFCFTMLQEMMARRLDCELGEYFHYAGSMHVYDEYLGSVKAYVEEGHHKDTLMPRMPDGDPFELVDLLLDAEDRIRHGERIVASDLFESTYWADVIRLIQAYWARGQVEKLDDLQADLDCSIYKPYVNGLKRLSVKQPKTRDPNPINR